jgi:hypothetical protein
VNTPTYIEIVRRESMPVDGLLDVAGAALLSADPTLATGLAPAAWATANTDRLPSGVVGSHFIPVDADEMPSQVVLAAEGPVTRGVGADMRLQPVGVMGGHVRLEVIRTGEGWKGCVMNE